MLSPAIKILLLLISFCFVTNLSFGQSDRYFNFGIKYRFYAVQDEYQSPVVYSGLAIDGLLGYEMQSPTSNFNQEFTFGGGVVESNTDNPNTLGYGSSDIISQPTFDFHADKNL